MELSRAARLLLLLLLSFIAATSAGGNETDRLSLLELKANIIDPIGALKTWNESTHFCEWSGVMCGHRHQRVIGLYINSSGLGGRLSPFIGNLSFLRRFDLDNNSFSHRIPEEIGRLRRLRTLYMDGNSFNGTIPVNISNCVKLRNLHMKNNNFSGEIPPEIGLLPNLELLDLGSNNFHGEIPNSIANLSNTLSELKVPDNYLGGYIPSGFGRLKMIWYLDLGDNKLSGKIPPSLYNLSLIQFFSVQTNKLWGEIPSRLGNKLLPNLEAFLFHSNLFSGPVPDISNASNLEHFEIATNILIGKVPNFSNLLNLRILCIGENILGSADDDDLDFLASLVNSTNLEVLDISHNQLGGKLPECFGNLSTDLHRIQFGDNHIKGSIPIGIENLLSLEVLGFEENQMIGPIPTSIVKLQNLGMLYLSYNKLSGSIPSSLGNLTLLNRLYLRSNELQGVIPSSLGECNQLELLSLKGNNLTGSIPNEVAAISSLSMFLDLSDNNFTGSIPNEVGQLINLGYLDFSNNKLSGEIPQSLGMCQVLEGLFLNDNSLQGSIPKSFGSLRGLIKINLDNNNLSGKIPTYMENFRFLEVASFENNNFEGEIPTKGIFGNASEIGVEGNPRLCGGIAELDLPKCQSKPNNKHKHKRSFAMIYSVVCGIVALLLLALLSWLLHRTRKITSQIVTVESPSAVSFLEVSYGDLLKATYGFCEENLIGTGSFGSVYKANILAKNNPLMVAVKVFNLQASRAFKSFESECKVLGSIKHRNIVKLITACSSIDFQGNDFKALVYEFMTNGSLEEWLHPRPAHNSEQDRHLDFIQRLNISIDVANALNHLHNNTPVSIVHSDLKPSNILLDGDMNARIGDFGLARFLEYPSSLFSSTRSYSIGIRGSIGYIAPEYSMGGQLSVAGDVYSYGILLLEMFAGKRPTDAIFRDSFNLHIFVKRSLTRRLSQIVDPSLVIDADQVEKEEKHYRSNAGASEICHVDISLWNCLKAVLTIGVSCSKERPKERMNIAEAVNELQRIKIAYMSNKTGG